VIAMIQVIRENQQDKKAALGVAGIGSAAYLGRGGLSPGTAVKQLIDKKPLGKVAKQIASDQKAGLSDNWSIGNIAKRVKSGYEQLTNN